MKIVAASIAFCRLGFELLPGGAVIGDWRGSSRRGNVGRCGQPPALPSLSSCPERVHCCPVQFRPTGRTACVAEGFRWIGRLGPRISARRRLSRLRPPAVMPGLVPGIHVLRHRAMDGRGRGGGGTWMPGTSPGMTTEGERGAGGCPPRPTLSPPPAVTPALSRGPGPQAPPSPGFPGPRLKAGVTAGGQGGRMRAGRDPCPDPAGGPETRLYRRLAPGPTHLNRTAMERVRA